MASYVKVAKKSEIPDQTGKLVQANGKDIALFKVEGKVCALYAHCPHQGGPLDEGGLDGKTVTCPWHGWDFDVTTGVCTFNDSIKQPVFNVKEEGDDVYVEA
ncbi:MAG: Rieske 2Fe-2S domain-containing protein [Candidatus Omnitrophica bacterium]|nr:Rieske 2Fe-2S domain-containing protein [Candidatus Omnitrophota bacterium]